MKNRLIIEEDSVYEIDELCMERKYEGSGFESGAKSDAREKYRMGQGERNQGQKLRKKWPEIRN